MILGPRLASCHEPAAPPAPALAAKTRGLGYRVHRVGDQNLVYQLGGLTHAVGASVGYGLTHSLENWHTSVKNTPLTTDHDS